MAGNIIRQIKIQDGTNEDILTRVNSLSELHVVDSSLFTLQNSALTKLTEIDNVIDNIDSTQIASITLQTASLSADNASYTKLVDIETAIAAVETNQTDKSQITQISDGTNEADIVQAADDTTDIEDKYGVVTNAVLNGRISNTAIRPLRIDSSTNTLQTIEYEHHEIHSGSHYMVCGYQDLSINQVLDFTWLMPNTTSWIHWTWDLECESETLYQVYEGAVATNPLANAVTPLNNNRNSANSSGTTMKYEIQASLAAANTDTDVTSAILLESGIVGSGKNSLGNTNRNREMILKQNTLYCLRATATAAGYINFCMQWYEHTDKN